jgi:hypothetical protein
VTGVFKPSILLLAALARWSAGISGTRKLRGLQLCRVLKRSFIRPRSAGIRLKKPSGNRAAGQGIEFWGGSFLSDPFGRIIAQASHDQEEILIGEVDLALIEETRRNWPFLRDRRIDAYKPITKRFLDPPAGLI